MDSICYYVLLLCCFVLSWFALESKEEINLLLARLLIQQCDASMMILIENRVNRSYKNNNPFVANAMINGKDEGDRQLPSNCQLLFLCVRNRLSNATNLTENAVNNCVEINKYLGEITYSPKYDFYPSFTTDQNRRKPSINQKNRKDCFAFLFHTKTDFRKKNCSSEYNNQNALVYGSIDRCKQNIFFLNTSKKIESSCPDARPS